MQGPRSRHHCLHRHTLWCLPSETMLPMPILEQSCTLLACALQE